MSLTHRLDPPHGTRSGRLHRMWSQYRRRVEAEGHWRTLTYAVGTFVLAHLGLEVRLVYASHTGEVPAGTAGAPIELIESFDGLRPADRLRITEFEGPRLLEAFRLRLSEGSRCALARDANGSLASACWVSPAPDYLLAAGESALIVHDCFTFPEMRGQGLYPGVLRSLRTLLLSGPEPAVATVLVNCVFSNWSSQRGIERAGFEREGIMFHLWLLRIAHRRAPSQRILRRF